VPDDYGCTGLARSYKSAEAKARRHLKRIKRKAHKQEIRIRNQENSREIVVE
jgi:hypothetical protein